MLKLKKPVIIKRKNYWLVWKSPREYCKAYSKKAIKTALILLDGGRAE